SGGTVLYFDLDRPGPRPNLDRLCCRPAYGQMFLFPSYFYHGTIPFRCSQRRICIAFNVEPLDS
ncbi:MAG TPA: hypothetical protein EYQ01_04405, partial [Nitrospira sp.]|nr:hypothetical protein [Candidatus Manganitrophaceae bacterium]